MVTWSVEYYVEENGKNPVKDFIQSLARKERAAVQHDLDVLAEFGLDAPFVRHMEGQLWEIKSGPARIFYVAHTGKRFVLLHGYYKKSRKAQRREVEVARGRLAAFLQAEKR